MFANSLLGKALHGAAMGGAQYADAKLKEDMLKKREARLQAVKDAEHKRNRSEAQADYKRKLKDKERLMDKKWAQDLVVAEAKAGDATKEKTGKYANEISKLQSWFAGKMAENSAKYQDDPETLTKLNEALKQQYLLKKSGIESLYGVVPPPPKSEPASTNTPEAPVIGLNPLDAMNQAAGFNGTGRGLMARHTVAQQPAPTQQPAPDQQPPAQVQQPAPDHSGLIAQYMQNKYKQDPVAWAQSVHADPTLSPAEKIQLINQ